MDTLHFTDELVANLELARDTRSDTHRLTAKGDITFLRKNVLDPVKAPWIRKPISEVTSADVASLVNQMKLRAPTQAFHTFRKLKTFFS